MMKKCEEKQLFRVLMVVSGLLMMPQIALSQYGQGGEGFLFRAPKVSLAFSLGYSIPNAQSDIFDFVEKQLTFEKSDLHRGYIGGESAIRLVDRLDLVIGVGHAESSLPSEFRQWVGADDLPIEQETLFSTTPVTVSARFYLIDR